ncbi:MAG: hypothetical protein PHD29_06235 [bacterium]|nr:hypothetical protein [bacterium]
MKIKSVVLIVITAFSWSIGTGVAMAQELRCKITVPAVYSIVRGDVPVYGFAEGEGFKEYKLEYGAGEDPAEWVLINQGKEPQPETGSIPKINFNQVKTIPGNLGLWDTGLTEYKYKEQKVDLTPGVYTLRLTASGQKDKTIEDRIIVEVGRVLLNASGGKIESTDKKALFVLPEHALYQASELICLKPIKTAAKNSDDLKMIGKIYELTPPGMKFTRNASLSFFCDKEEAIDSKQIQIFTFDPEKGSWQGVDTFWNERSNCFETFLNGIPDKFAVYVLGISQTSSNAPKEEIAVAPIPADSKIFCQDSFETGPGQWQNKNREIGAALSLERSNDSEKGQSLKITTQVKNGSNACIITNQAFNAGKYPLVSFDYKIPAGLKTNFQVKTGSAWHEIIFTDDEKTYWDINMDRVGKIDGIIANDQWHHAEFNLYEMLKTKTKDFLVTEMTMADWDSTGFAKLENGHNPIGVYYYIDNFIIKEGE